MFINNNKRMEIRFYHHHSNNRYTTFVEPFDVLEFLASNKIIFKNCILFLAF